jgi:hypothetical protein
MSHALSRAQHRLTRRGLQGNYTLVTPLQAPLPLGAPPHLVHRGGQVGDVDSRVRGQCARQGADHQTDVLQGGMGQPGCAEL